jgi:hypothetical protein
VGGKACRTGSTPRVLPTNVKGLLSQYVIDVHPLRTALRLTLAGTTGVPVRSLPPLMHPCTALHGQAACCPASDAA